MRILLVEDDRHTQDFLKASLIEENFLVDEAEDGETAWELLQQFPYDLVLLDVMLPRLDGISLCQRLRQAENPIPLLLLTTRSEVSDKLLGLESGADDYVTKPFHLQELVARIRTVARRNPTTVNLVLTCDRLCLDPTSRQVTYAGQELKIGRKEYLILELFLRHPHQVFNRSDFIDRLWSLDQEIPTEATVKSHIRRIRRKLEEVGAADLIETLYGQGYRLNPALVEAPEQQTATTQPLSESSVKQVNELIAQVWQRAYGKSLEKIGELEQAIAKLQANQLDEPTRHQAIFTAHKLAGSLHIFGFEVAAQLLQAIEDEFRQESVGPAITPQLQQWLEMVRLELTGQQSSIAQIQMANRQGIDEWHCKYSVERKHQAICVEHFLRGI
jgi:DNA-binding response OmpR family regulator/HPt (histidine-containing phosphotransfer) domain-containing protein